MSLYEKPSWVEGKLYIYCVDGKCEEGTDEQDHAWGEVMDSVTKFAEAYQIDSGEMFVRISETLCAAISDSRKGRRWRRVSRVWKRVMCKD